MSYREITVDELEALVGDGVRVVDVREADEYTGGHVPGAVHVPLSTVAERAAEIGAMGTVYLICHSGGRSAHACDFLSRQGIDAVNVVGGTMAWALSGRAVVAGNSPT
ncbi:MAG: rhodanese-like domain-containing protein [Ilumatobacteraceae bacterium]|jgi:rhodanese-related sulfurtransferase